MPKPPPPPQRPMSPKHTSGTVDRVPCPHCGRPNDLRALRDQMLLIEEAQFDCDHCGRVMEFLGMKSIQVVTVRQTQRRDLQGAVKRVAPVQEARTTSIAQVTGRRR